jgi:PAS domain S-box-containing protein
LGLLANSPAFFSAEYQEIAAEIANQLAIAVRQMRLTEAVARHTAELERSVAEIRQAEDALRAANETLEQRVAERTLELKHSMERVEAILNNSTDPILLIDAALRIRQTNPAFSALFAVERRDSSERLMTDFILSDDVDRLLANIETVITEQTGKHVELRCIRADGTAFDAAFSIGYFAEAQGGEGLVCIIQDITERKNAEEALRRALAQEKELGELKSRFVSMASHEFRTPLATILAAAETLSAYRQQMTDSQIDHRVHNIRQQVQHLKNIIEDVLQLARIQSGRLEFNPALTNLDGLCRSVIDEFESHPDVTHELVYRCDEKLRETKLDNRLMRQIINNLVSNAIKYSPGADAVFINLEHSNQALILSVRDQGIGIPEADLYHLFEPFHRAANVGTISGTGLGLSITKEAVELHGGTIEVESQVGVGTRFVVTIPISTNREDDHDENPGD